MQTNESRNGVVHYRRATDGAIAEMERTATGGAGSGTFKPISGQESAPNLQRQPPRAQGADREAEGGLGVRVLPRSKRKEGRGLDAVLPAAGRPARSVTATARLWEKGVEIMMITRVACLAALAAVAAVAWPKPCSAADAPGAMAMPGHDAKAQAVADGQGNLHVPSDYRTTYEFLGTWAVAAKPGPGSKEIHDVYASPGTIAAFHKDGHFPDGTGLVKQG